MECIHIDFDVLETNNPKKLMIGDTSINWLTAKEHPAYLYITFPGSKKEKIFTFEKGSIIVYNSNNLGLSTPSGCKKDDYLDLPDGLYKIKLQSSFEEIFVEKYYLKTDIMEKEIAKAIVKFALNKSTNNESFINRIFEVEWKIKVAKSFTLEGNAPMVMRYYNEAVKLFNRTCKS